MPIRINLLAEAQAAEELRRKDPVKRAIWLAGFVVFLMLLWGLTLFLKTITARSELAGLETKWKELAKTVKQVEDNRKDTLAIERKLAALSQFTTNRFLWANALNTLQFTCVDKVALVSLKSEQTYQQKEAPKAKKGAAKSAAAAAAVNADSAVEKIVLYLNGKDFSPRLAEQVPRFKAELRTSPFFDNALGKTNSILLTSLSAPQVEGDTKETYVVFGLQLNFQEKERRLYE